MLPDCEPLGIDALGEERSPEDPGIEGEGKDALDPERPPPDGEGMLGDEEPRPPDPPALPDDPPDEPPDGGPDDGELGEGMEVDWLAQPPMSIADTALTPAM